MTAMRTLSVYGTVRGAATAWAALFLRVRLDVLDHIGAPFRLLVADQASEHLIKPASLLIALLSL